MKAAAVLVGTRCLWMPPLVTTKTAADAWLLSNTRGRDGGIRQELAARMTAPMQYRGSESA